MATDTVRPSSFVPLLAGLVPLFLMVHTAAGGLMVAGGFLIAFTTAFISNLYLPPVFRRQVVFIASVLFATIGVSVYASLVRIIDPFLYERYFVVLYMVCFTAPVYHAAGSAYTEPDRDRGWENLAQGLGLSVSVFAVGLVRELLTTGSILFTLVPEDQSRTILAFFAQPSGAFVLLSLLLATARLAARLLKRGPV